MISAHALQREIEPLCSSEQTAWLNDAIDKLQADTILRLSPAVKRKFSQTVQFQDAALHHWYFWDAVRVLLLMKLVENSDLKTRLEILSLYFRSGDSHEKMALLKGLAYLDAGDDFLDLALSAVRVNDPEIFAAIALANPYPASAFPELNWNQMVLKALHLKLDINFIVNLKARVNPALSNMVADYIEELLLAGRQYPPSAWEAIEFSHLHSLPEQLLAALINSSDHVYLLRCLNNIEIDRLSSQAFAMLKHSYATMTEDTVKLKLKQLIETHENRGIE